MLKDIEIYNKRSLRPQRSLYHKINSYNWKAIIPFVGITIFIIWMLLLQIGETSI